MLSGAPEQSARAERFERLTLLSRSPDQTRQLGQALGRVVQGGDVLLLDGPFGAGKTVLVQGVAAGLGVQGYVSSPSFIMINEHHGRLPLYHVDLYRMEHQLDAETLDALDEYLNGEGVCVVAACPPDKFCPDLAVIQGQPGVRGGRIDCEQHLSSPSRPPAPKLPQAAW